ncbi:MAG TPA: ABC transporter permease [Xanthobacteraceae bacterium]|nr:ABC transporter permease [Xanthobacteraceae bacterium]
MTASGAANGPAWRLLLPLGAFFVLFFAAPLVVLLMVSLSDGLSLNAFSPAQYAKFLGDTFSLGILLDTLALGVKATTVCLVFGLPLAWVCVHAGPRLRALLLFLVILPILTSVVVRTFAWIVILGQQGILNKAFLALGLIDRPLRLLFSEVGVVMVLAQVQMPLMVLPLMTTLQRIDPNLADASRALGAGHWRTFRRVILPLWRPGLVAGSILVFAACTTAFVTQTLIGGARLVYMPLYIYQQAAGANNWPFAAAMSVVLMVSVLLVVYLLNLAGRTQWAARHG